MCIWICWRQVLWTSLDRVQVESAGKAERTVEIRSTDRDRAAHASVCERGETGHREHASDALLSELREDPERCRDSE